MHLCLIILAYLMGKFYIVKELFSADDLQRALSIDVKGAMTMRKKCSELKREIERVQESLNSIRENQS